MGNQRWWTALRLDGQASPTLPTCRTPGSCGASSHARASRLSTTVLTDTGDATQRSPRSASSVGCARQTAAARPAITYGSVAVNGSQVWPAPRRRSTGGTHQTNVDRLRVFFGALGFAIVGCACPLAYALVVVAMTVLAHMLFWRRDKSDIAGIDAPRARSDSPAGRQSSHGRLRAWARSRV